MAYGPAELGIQAAEQRPYGETAQEIADSRKRRAAAQQGAPAQPTGTQSPDAQDRNKPTTPGLPIHPDARDESVRNIQRTGAQPSLTDPLGDIGRYRASDVARQISHVPLLGGAAQTFLFSPMRTFGDLYDLFIKSPQEQMIEEDRTLAQMREEGAKEQDPEKKRRLQSAYLEYQAQALSRRVIAGSLGDTEGVAAPLSRAVAEQVGRLSSVVQRLGALGLARDAKAAESEMMTLARSQPRGIATQEHVEALEDIIGALQGGGHYAGREVSMTSDLARLKKMREGVAAREKAIAEGKAPPPDISEQFDTMVGDAGKVTPKEKETTPSSEAPAKPGEMPGTPPPQEPPAPPAKGGAEPPVPPTGPEVNLGINLDKIDAPQHIKDLIEVEARAHIGDITAQRRGVQPLETTFAKAKNLGIDVPSIAQIRAGTAFNAEGAVSLFNAIVKTAQRRTAIEEEIRQAGVLASPEMEARWLASVYDQNALQRVFAGGRAEAGRSMRALRELSSGAQSGQIKDTFSRALDAIGGRRNFDKLLQRLKDIQTSPMLNPLEREIAAFKFVGKLDKPRFFEKINEAFINSILSNPLTHEANILGQSALIYADMLSQFPAAAFDTVITGGGRIAPRNRSFSGAVTSAVAAHMALRRGIREGLLYMRYGVAKEHVEKFREEGIMRRQALEGSAGTFLNLPTRALGAEDVLFNALGYQRQLYQDAANYVARDGRSSIFSKDFWRRVGDIVDHPDEFLMDGVAIQKRAEEAGARAGLRQDAGDFQKSLQHVLHWEVGETGLRPGVFIAPFVRIGFNLARVGAEYSPLGFVRAAKTTGGERADAVGRGMVGSALWYSFWQKADVGELTGAAPSDPREAAQFYDEGKRPYAIKVGNSWLEYGRYEPIATTLKWIYGLNQAEKEIAQGTADPALVGAAVLKGIGTITRGLTDSSFLQGINDFYGILSSSDATAGQKAERFAGNLANSILPYSGMRRFIAQREDSTLRKPSGFAEQIEASTPGMSRLVKPHLTHWGEPVQRPELTGGLVTQEERIDPVDVELSKVVPGETLNIDGQDVTLRNITVGLVQTEIDTLKLSRSEGFMLQQVAGRATHTALAELFNGNTVVRTESGEEKAYRQMDDREKLQAVKGVISQARRTARATVADAVLLSATTDEEVKRAARMRLSTISKVSDRADFLSGLDIQGKLTPAVRDYLNRQRGKGERTVEQYLALAKGQ